MEAVALVPTRPMTPGEDRSAQAAVTSAGGWRLVLFWDRSLVMLHAWADVGLVKGLLEAVTSCHFDVRPGRC